MLRHVSRAMLHRLDLFKPVRSRQSGVTRQHGQTVHMHSTSRIRVLGLWPLRYGWQMIDSAWFTIQQGLPPFAAGTVHVRWQLARYEQHSYLGCQAVIRMSSVRSPAGLLHIRIKNAILEPEMAGNILVVGITYLPPGALHTMVSFKKLQMTGGNVAGLETVPVAQLLPGACCSFVQRGASGPFVVQASTPDDDSSWFENSHVTPFA